MLAGVAFEERAVIVVAPPGFGLLAGPERTGVKARDPLSDAIVPRSRIASWHEMVSRVDPRSAPLAASR